MQALQVTRFGGPEVLELRAVDTPDPPPGEVLVRVRAAGVNFGDIIIRTGGDGQVTRLRDVARIEMGADAYALRSLLDGEPAVALQIVQSPGANALDASQAVRATTSRLSAVPMT